MERVVITQGQRFVTAEPDVEILTLLGSCVACCLWDPNTRVGGMNHILLQQAQETSGAGTYEEVEQLIRDLVRLGASRGRLFAKVFGGAMMNANFGEIGANNAKTTLAFLDQQGIPCLAQSLGGQSARQIIFSPSTGKVRQRMTRRRDELVIGQRPDLGEVKVDLD